MTILKEAPEGGSLGAQNSMDSLEYDELTAMPFKLEREDSDHFDDLNALPFRGLGLIGDGLHQYGPTIQQCPTMLIMMHYRGPRNPLFQDSNAPSPIGSESTTTPRASPSHFGGRGSMKRVSSKSRGRSSSLKRNPKAKAALLQESQRKYAPQHASISCQLTHKWSFARRRLAPNPPGVPSPSASPKTTRRRSSNITKETASQQVVESLFKGSAALPRSFHSPRPRVGSVDKGKMNLYERRKLLGESSRSKVLAQLPLNYFLYLLCSHSSRPAGKARLLPKLLLSAF
jgi:hypothetical protein